MDSLAPATSRRACVISVSSRQIIALLAIGAALTCGGCVSQGGVKQAMGKTLAAIGLKSDGANGQERAISLRLHAADNLNAGSGKRALALVVRVYKLRGAQRFDQAPFDSFLDEKTERAALGDDLIGATEILLLPGQRHALVEQAPVEAAHLGVVALFRSPAPNRWRFTFDSRKAAKDGVTLGLHACALTTTSPAVQTTLSTEPYSLASARCTATRR